MRERREEERERREQEKKLERERRETEKKWDRERLEEERDKRAREDRLEQRKRDDARALKEEQQLMVNLEQLRVMEARDRGKKDKSESTISKMKLFGDAIRNSMIKLGTILSIFDHADKTIRWSQSSR